MEQRSREEADRRFEEALNATGARDPRDFYRGALRELKETDPSGYDQAVRYFQEVLVPSIASGEAEPLQAWRAYGCMVAQLTAPGQTVEIDETGRSAPFTPEASMDRLVLQLPEERGRALLVSLPANPSRAQRATWELLVQGKQRRSGEG